ncbi:hypothetical protein LQ567_05175 [Niabella pedocola]|uniref:Uncharacterized protein n=1 Tax=Niabella pedocola TaxID=1752077 RepID=A0ABS8PM19_9BACT|nr:hypothetical protein [Niabella pedocola]MCD2422144.1 hypothetical protein [Niabella pedocola]
MNKNRKWCSILTGLKMDNVLLKDWLSKAISGQVSSGFVEQAELFQQEFCEKDLIIDLLRRDMALLKEAIAIQGMTDVNSAQYMALEAAVQRLLLDFQKMKNAFIEFVERGAVS